MGCQWHGAGTQAGAFAFKAGLVEHQRMVDDIARRFVQKINDRSEFDIGAGVAGKPGNDADATGHGQKETGHDYDQPAAHIGARYCKRHCHPLHPRMLTIEHSC